MVKQNTITMEIIVPDMRDVRHSTNLARNDPRYDYFVCPRHRPIARPRYPLLLPPELLIDIFIEIASHYLAFLFSSEMQDDDEIEERLAANPFPAFLHVSHQFRELAFKVLAEAFGIHRDPYGCLPKGAWSCLRYVLKHVYLLQRATPDAVEEHAKQGSSYEIPHTLKGYLCVARLNRSDPEKLLEEALRGLDDDMKLGEALGPNANAVLRFPLSSNFFGVVWSVQFRISLLPFAFLRLVPVDDVDDCRKDIVIRACYRTFSVLFGVPIAIPERRLRLEGEHPLVPVRIPIPQGINADLVTRYKYLSCIWELQSCPILAADQGLKKMTQSMLDSCLAIAMPDRPLTSKASRQRRASFSAFQDIRARPRLPLKPPCHCERRLLLI